MSTVCYSPAVHLSKDPDSSSLLPESGYRVHSKQVQFAWLPLLISLPSCLSSNGLAAAHQHLPYIPFIQTWEKCYKKTKKRTRTYRSQEKCNLLKPQISHTTADKNQYHLTNISHGQSAHNWCKQSYSFPGLTHSCTSSLP